MADRNEGGAHKQKISFKLPEDKLRKWYQEDLIAPPKIAEMAGCSRQTVMNALDAYDIPHMTQQERHFAIVDKQRAKLDKMVEERKRPDEIAKALGVSPTVIRKYAKENNVPISSHSRYRNMLTEENLRKWYVDEGMSQQNIADIVGCHYSAVARAMKKYDIPIKDRDGIVASMRNTVQAKYGADAPFRCESIQKNRSMSREMTMTGERDKIVAKAQKLRKDKGLSVKKAAEKLGISYFILRRWIREAEDPSKVRTGRRSSKPIHEDECKKLIGEGATIKSLSEYFGCCPVTVMKALKKYGLKTQRSRS